MSQREPTSTSYRSDKRPEKVVIADRRLDERGYEEFRPVFLSTGALSQAAGSAYAEFGSTKVMVGVYGPRESDRKEAYTGKGRVQCDIRRTSFSTTDRNKARQSDADKASASIMQTALEAAIQMEAFPKSVVDVYCLVLESGGSDLPILITAASLALADAGIPLYDLVSACNISRVGGQLLLDPTLDESYRESGGCLLAMMPKQSKVTQIVVSGEWSNSQLSALIELGMGGCLQLDAALRQALLEGLK